MIAMPDKAAVAGTFLPLVCSKATVAGIVRSAAKAALLGIALLLV
jgi:hypothetical protein